MRQYKKYSFGPWNCQTYFRPAGKGFEVGFKMGRDTVFFSNFVFKEEAKRWYSHLNKEVKFFANEYVANSKTPRKWYYDFFSNHLYNTYYQWLDQQFASHKRKFDKAYKSDRKEYAKWFRNEGEDYQQYRWRQAS